MQQGRAAALGALPCAVLPAPTGLPRWVAPRPSCGGGAPADGGPGAVPSPQVCTNQRRCHCHPGWKPPDCSRRGSALGGRADGGPGPAERGESRGRARRHGGSAAPPPPHPRSLLPPAGPPALRDAARTWPLLPACLLPPALAVAALLLLLRREARGWRGVRGGQ